MALRQDYVAGPRHHLFLAGCDLVALAREHGTPLYVYDERYLRAQCRAFREAIEAFAPAGGEAHYASKAFSTVAMCRIAAQEGLGLDVVSAGEMYTARSAGFPMNRVTLHGNAKTREEMELALDWGIGRYIVDNLTEIEPLQRLAEERGRKIGVIIRLNPGIDAHTHEAVQTARTDCKFGLGISDGEALNALKKIARCPNLELFGLHTHIGSQIFEIAPFLQAVDCLTDFAVLASVVTGLPIRELIVGGGFGVRYTEKDPPSLDPRESVHRIARELDKQCARKGIAAPKLIVEPGRAIVAEAGAALYTVCATKEIPGVRKYVSLDGGMTDNPRVALYGARYQAVAANRADERPAEIVALAGCACESDDVFGYDFVLPRLEVGDIVMIPTSGAYHYSMASNYNRVPFPKVLLLRNGQAETIVERQRVEEITRYDRLPGHLKY